MSQGKQEKQLDKSQMVIDSVAYFIIVSSALYVASGILFPSSMPASKTTTAMAPGPSSYLLNDRIDKNVNSDPIDTTRTVDSYQEKKEKKREIGLNFWSIFALGDDNQDDHECESSHPLADNQPILSSIPVPEMVSPLTEQSASQILLEHEIEKKIKTALNHTFIDDEENDVKNEESQSVKETPTDENINDEIAYEKAIYAWFTTAFLAEDSEMKEEASKPLKNEAMQPFDHASFYNVDVKSQEEGDSIVAHTPKAASKINEEDKGQIKKPIKNEKESIESDSFKETEEPENLITLLKFYESLLKLQKIEPSAVSSALLNHVQSKIIRLLNVNEDVKNDDQVRVVESTDPNTLVEEKLDKWADTYLVSPELEKSSPIFVEIMTFLKRQFAVKNDNFEYIWDSALVGDLNDDSPLDNLLVSLPENCIHLKGKTRPNPVSSDYPKVQSQNKQKKRKQTFDCDSIVVEDKDANNAIEEVMGKVTKVPNRQQVNPMEKQSSKTFKEKNGDKAFDWDSVFVENFDSNSPFEKVFVKVTEPPAGHQVTPQQKQKTNASKKKNTEQILDWDSVLVGDVLVNPSQKLGNQKVKPPPTQASLNNPEKNKPKKKVQNFDWDSVLVKDTDSDDPIEELLVKITEKRDRSTEKQSADLPKTNVKFDFKKGSQKDSQKAPIINLDLRNIFVFEDDKDEGLILAPKPKSTKPHNVRGFNWNIAPKIFKEKNIEKKQKEFATAKQDLEKSVRDKFQNVKRFGFSWNLAPKVYKSSPESAEKGRKEYQRAKKKVESTIKNMANQIF